MYMKYMYYIIMFTAKLLFCHHMLYLLLCLLIYRQKENIYVHIRYMNIAIDLKYS